MRSKENERHRTEAEALEKEALQRLINRKFTLEEFEQELDEIAKKLPSQNFGEQKEIIFAIITTEYLRFMKMCLIVYEDKICLFNEEVKNCVKSVLHSEMGFDNIEIFCLAFQILFNVPNKKLPIVTFLHAFVALERMSYGRQNLYKINNIIDCGKIRQVYFTNGFIMPVKTELRSIDPRVRLTYRAMASVTNECSYDRAVIRTYSFSRFIAVDAGENGSFLNGVLKSIKETDWRLGLWEFRSLYDDLNKRELMLKNATERKFNAFNRAMIKKWGSRWRDFFKEKK